MPRNALSEFEMQIRKSIANNINQYRHLRNISQAELSRRAHMPTSTIGGYMQLLSTPNFDRIQRLANALNVQPADLDPRQRKLTDVNSSFLFPHGHQQPTFDQLFHQLSIDRQQKVWSYLKEQLELQNLTTPSGSD